MCLYAQSQLAALATVVEHVRELGIDCDLEAVPNYVYAETDDELGQLEAEVDAAHDAGLHATLEHDLAVPFPALAAVCLPHQAQFHPRKYLLGLAAAITARGGRIFEGSRVTDLEADDEPVVVRTGSGTVRARNVVLATHVPITNRGLFYARVHPRRAYAVAARLRDPVPFEGMWINIGEPTRSLRTVPDGEGGRLVLVCGEGHRVGQEDDAEARYAHLERFLVAHFGDAEMKHRWSTQDVISVDGLPYIGRIGGDDAPVLTATGFGGWGLTSGTLAGMLLADDLLGRRELWADLYDTGRAALVQSALRFLRENANVAARLVGGKLARHETSPDEILPGEGRVVDLPEGPAAVYRTLDDEMLAVSAACTHMGCLVSWNAAESSWDCPCHGSRFDVHGTVLEGPATRPLEPVEVEQPVPSEDESESRTIARSA
jgi:glycine/D-amino acid oxidase-like deaminating enzyme/nitrite reductase/ring-hydroxylating ferredoxin subunit